MAIEITGHVTESGWIPGGLGGWCSIREDSTGGEFTQANLINAGLDVSAAAQAMLDNGGEGRNVDADEAFGGDAMAHPNNIRATDEQLWSAAARPLTGDHWDDEGCGCNEHCTCDAGYCTCWCICRALIRFDLDEGRDRCHACGREI